MSLPQPLNQAVIAQALFDLRNGQLRRCRTMGFAEDVLEALKNPTLLSMLTNASVSWCSVSVDYDVLARLLIQAQALAEEITVVDRMLRLEASTEMVSHFYGLLGLKNQVQHLEPPRTGRACGLWTCGRCASRTDQRHVQRWRVAHSADLRPHAHSPLLSFIKILNLLPTPQVLHLQLESKLSANGQSFSAQWLAPKASADEAGRCLQEPIAKQAAQKIRNTGHANVISVETERIREIPPLPFDLGSLQETCSRQLGLDVQDTLNIAQSLYETHKAITYPRTDCGYLPVSMLAEVSAVLDSLLKTDATLKPVIDQLDRNQRSRAWNDHKITAHHGMIPTLEPANLSAMNEKELAVYRLIRAHYLVQFLPTYEFDGTVVRFSCDSETLQATGKQVLVQGWRLVLAESDDANGKDSAQRSQTLPALHEGMACQVANVDLKSFKTQPPKPYTQGELVKAMKGVARFVTDPRLKQKLKDTTGIGTEATRANIISGLFRSMCYALPT